MKPSIRLEALTREGSVLRYRFGSELDLFKKKDFFIEYKKELGDPPESVLTLPFIAMMMPIAWAAGADVVASSVDAAFADSLERASAYWRKCYPRWPFHSELKASRVENSFKTSRAGMLFSSGLDSLATYVRQRGKKPELFTVIGADFPYSKSNFAVICKEQLFEDFAQREAVELTYIYTDINDILDLDKLARYATNWYGAVQHGLMLMSLVAPVSCGYLKELFIASCSHRPDPQFPCGSEPDVVRHFRWAGSEAVDDLHDINRAQKIGRYLKSSPELHRYLRVCWAQFDEINCSRCEKCLRTICEILLNNLDPNAFNFKVTGETLAFLKRKLRSRYYLFYRGNEGVLNFWREIQDGIDLERLEDRYGSKEFFAWLKDFKKLRKKQSGLLVSFWTGLLRARDFWRETLAPRGKTAVTN